MKHCNQSFFTSVKHGGLQNRGVDEDGSVMWLDSDHDSQHDRILNGQDVHDIADALMELAPMVGFKLL